MWPEMIVRALCELRAAGVTDFDVAWARALALHPPRGRDMGEQRPRLFATDGSDGELSPVEFLRVSCEDAWADRRPVLRHLTSDLFSERLVVA